MSPTHTLNGVDIPLGRELLEALLDRTPSAVMITDSEPRILYINPAFSRVTGYCPAEAIGRNPNMLSSGRQDPEFYAQMWATLDAEGSWEGEIWNRKKNGELYPEWLTITALEATDGRPIYAAVFVDIEQFRNNHAELFRLAHHDALTGLPNRILLDDRLHHALDRAKRNEGSVGVLFVDLDRFKRLNDESGHAAGDAALQHVGRQIEETIRRSDTAARWGGDEFVCVLEDVRRPQAIAALAHRILEAIQTPFEGGNGPIQVAASIGTAVFPRDGRDGDEVLEAADQAMYRAKSQGGAQVVSAEDCDV